MFVHVRFLDAVLNLTLQPPKFILGEMVTGESLERLGRIEGGTSQLEMLVQLRQLGQCCLFDLTPMMVRVGV